MAGFSEIISLVSAEHCSALWESLRVDPTKVQETISLNPTYDWPQGGLGTTEARQEAGGVLRRVGDIPGELVIQGAVQTEAPETQTH